LVFGRCQADAQEGLANQILHRRIDLRIGAAREPEALAAVGEAVREQLER